MNNDFEFVVRISVTSCSSASDMCEWAEEHSINCTWRALHTDGAFGPGRVIAFHFLFENETDAAAFKLRWM